MIIEEFGNYIFISIEAKDWKTYGHYLLEDIKEIPNRIYIPQTKCWRINKTERHYLSRYLSPFTEEEEAEGDRIAKEFLHQFETDTSYNL